MIKIVPIPEYQTIVGHYITKHKGYDKISYDKEKIFLSPESCAFLSIFILTSQFKIFKEKKIRMSRVRDIRLFFANSLQTKHKYFKYFTYIEIFENGLLIHNVITLNKCTINTEQWIQICSIYVRYLPSYSCKTYMCHELMTHTRHSLIILNY